MLKKIISSCMFFEIVYSNGDVESCRVDSFEAKNRFYDFVRYVVDKYLDGFSEVRLLDISGRLFRSYCQNS